LVSDKEKYIGIKVKRYLRRCREFARTSAGKVGKETEVRFYEFFCTGLSAGHWQNDKNSYIISSILATCLAHCNFLDSTVRDYEYTYSRDNTLSLNQGVYTVYTDFTLSP
jgi:hypothetical protein